MLTDVQIAQNSKILPIWDVAATLGIQSEDLDPYGKYKAKLNQHLIDRLSDKPDGKLILVTAVNPTPAGEGKTTVTVGLGEGMAKIGKKAVIALREPSLGPVFGMKGGAAGGGYAQVIPMEDINLHFTGDIHAVTAANNLLSAVIDNHIHHGNKLGIDQRKIVFKRCMDMNDRSLRYIVAGLGGRSGGIPRQDGFNITVASEVMAVLCLSEDLSDLKRRLNNILVAYTYSGEPVYCRDIGCAGAMALLLKDAINPNLVQTLENTPAIIHGGPFANIAHGCNSVRATKLALKLADYTITEAGFGSDLGAEKFFDIKCRAAGLIPSCVVLVVTARALKYNGGVSRNDLHLENTEALQIGSANLVRHIENLKKYGVPVVVAINAFANDSIRELDYISSLCTNMGVDVSLAEGFAKGGEGMTELCQAVCKAADKSDKNNFRFLYDLGLPIRDKLDIIAKEIYGAGRVIYTTQGQREIDNVESLGGGNLPVCVAKTQFSFSDDPLKLGCPDGFDLTVRDARLYSGAGFVTVYTGDILTMPGLPKNPAALNMDISADGTVTGLF